MHPHWLYNCLGDAFSRKTKFGGFHLRQATGIVALGVGLFIVNIILSSILYSVPMLVMLMGIIMLVASLGILALAIIGIINAVNMEEKELPIVGSYFSSIFKGIE